MFFPHIAMRTGTGPGPAMRKLRNYAIVDKTLFYGNERRKATADGRGWESTGRAKDIAAAGLRSTGWAKDTAAGGRRGVIRAIRVIRANPRSIQVRCHADRHRAWPYG